jgi:MFS family permease
MRKLTFLIAAAAAFGLGPFASKLGAVTGSALLILLAALLAIAASSTLSALSAAGGALGAFACSVLSGTSPAVAGAAFVGLAFAERSSRVRGQSQRLLHIGATLLVGALAGSLTTAYGAASPAVRAVAVVVAAVLVALPLLIDADHPVAHALESAADEVSEPARAALREGAGIRRNAEEAVLDRKTAEQVKQTWASLLRLAEARMRLERSVGAARGSALQAATAPSQAKPSHADAVVKMVDQRIGEHVTALTRAYTAVDAAAAAEVGLDDAALRGVETVGDSLEEVSKAMVEQS